MFHNNSKREVALKILAAGNCSISLDPRPLDVIVPPWHKHTDHLILVFGLPKSLVIPIPDLCLNELSISGTLSFNGSRHFCYIPWQHVFAVCNDDKSPPSMAWPEHMPSTILSEIQERLAAGFSKPAHWTTKSGKKIPSYLQLVK